MIKLYHGDCLEYLSDVSDGSVDLVLTDPPYNLSRKNNFKTMGRAGIDFGEWDKDADLFSYMDDCFRVLKKDGSFIVFNAWFNLGRIKDYAENLGFVTKDLLRLEKTNPMPRNRDRRYVCDFEHAIWFTMPKAKWVFNRQNDTYDRPKYVCPIDKGLHPTQKSLKLMEEIIVRHSNTFDMILDPFMGSGTTGLAAVMHDRHFIGIERDNHYFKVASDRIIYER